VTAPQQNRLCGKCGSFELRRRPRTPLNYLFSFSTYKCGRCANRESKFRFSLMTCWVALVLLSVGGGLTYWLMPAGLGRADDSQLNTADALARAKTSPGALSTFEQMMRNKPRSTMDNAAVLKLWRASVGVDVIMQMIRTSNPDYDLSAGAVIELKQAGVDQDVILAMIDATSRTR
jgi:hypothetical protein